MLERLSGFGGFSVFVVVCVVVVVFVLFPPASFLIKKNNWVDTRTLSPLYPRLAYVLGEHSCCSLNQERTSEMNFGIGCVCAAQFALHSHPGACTFGFFLQRKLKREVQHWCSRLSSPWDGIAGTLKSGCGVEGGSAQQFRSAGSFRPKTPFRAETPRAAAMLRPGLRQQFVGTAAS